MYNDGIVSNYAHMKGVLAYDPEDKSGFLLTHSIPSFPPKISNNVSGLTINDLKYPNSGYRNG